MPRFVDLPSEVLLIICTFLGQRDLAVLSRCHSTLIPIARRYLYEALHLGEIGFHHLTKFMSDNPDMAKLVKSVKVDGSSHKIGLPDLQSPIHYDELYAQIIKHWSVSQEEADLWSIKFDSDQLDHRNEAHLAVLLTQLTELKSLDLAMPIVDCRFDEFDEDTTMVYDLENSMVWRVLQRHGAHDLPSKFRSSLSKVTDFTIRGELAYNEAWPTGELGQDGFPLDEALYMATSFENLERLVVERGWICERPGPGSTIALPTSLTKLELLDCRFDQYFGDLEDLLSAIRPLQSLVIQLSDVCFCDEDGHAIPPEDVEEDCYIDASLLTSALESHAHSIQDLFIANHPFDHEPGAMQPSGSLSKFTNLRRLVIDTRFIPFPDWDEFAGDIDDIIDFFPTSLEELRISTFTGLWAKENLWALGELLQIQNQVPALKLLAIDLAHRFNYGDSGDLYQLTADVKKTAETRKIDFLITITSCDQSLPNEQWAEATLWNASSDALWDGWRDLGIMRM